MSGYMYEMDLRNKILPRPIPPYYIVEKRYSREIPGSITPWTALLLRMQRCLYLFSIRIDTIEENNKLHLTTVENIPLVVCFWEKQSSMTSQEKYVVVEIQCKIYHNGASNNCGSDPLGFLKYASRILSFLGNKGVARDINENNGVVNQKQLDCNSSALAGDQIYHDIENMLIDRQHMKSSPHCDSMKMIQLIESYLLDSVTMQRGLEILNIMTCPEKVGVKASLITAYIILLGIIPSTNSNTDSSDAPAHYAATLSKIVLNLALGEQKSCGDVQEEDEEVDEYNLQLTHQSSNNLRYFALNAFLNAIEVVIKFSNHIYFENDNDNQNNKINNNITVKAILLQFLKRSQDELKVNAIEALTTIIRSSAYIDDTHSAFCAMKALRCICACCGDDEKNQVLVGGCLDDILNKFRMAQRHYLLQIECNLLGNLLHYYHQVNQG